MWLSRPSGEMRQPVAVFVFSSECLLAWLKLLMMTALIPNCDAECKSADMIRRGVPRLVPWDGGPEWMEAEGHFDVVV